MKFYLSSYKIGNKPTELKRLVGPGRKIAYIPNALDFAEESERKQQSNLNDIKLLEDLGIKVEILDLRDYFHKKKELKNKLSEFGGLWVRGGNTFVLRQAMKLSGLDKLLVEMNKDDFVYGGYSAAGCVLSPKFDYLKIVDDPNIFPYEIKKQIWKGIGLIDYAFLPHYDSDHPESADIEKELEYCKKNNIPYKTLKDGEVIIIE